MSDLSASNALMYRASGWPDRMVAHPWIIVVIARDKNGPLLRTGQAHERIPGARVLSALNVRRFSGNLGQTTK